MTVLLLVSAFLSLFFSGLVFLKKNKAFPDYMLGSWFIFTAFHMVMLYIQMYNARNNYPFPGIIGTDIPLVAVHPIWIFLYIASFIHPKSRNYRVLWHLLPVVAMYLVLLFTFYVKDDSEKIRSYNQALEGTAYIDKQLELSVYLVISVALAYLIASYRVLRKHKKSVRNQYSNLQGVDLKWLRVMLYSIAVAFLLNALFDLTRSHTDFLPPKISIYFGYIVILTGISYVGFHGIRQTSFFIDDPDLHQGVAKPEFPLAAGPGQANSGSSQDHMLEPEYRRLLQYMEEEKPYLNFDLNLAGLANSLSYKPQYLSQLINQKTGTNFFDFVNQYRVQEFKLRAREPGNQVYTLISLAYDCGFNSKATFNRVFKNLTGHTPSAFLKDPDLQ